MLVFGHMELRNIVFRNDAVLRVHLFEWIQWCKVHVNDNFKNFKSKLEFELKLPYFRCATLF